MFSEVSMRQYMQDEIRERLQMIRNTAESADGRCSTSSHETLLHLAAGLGEVQLLGRLLQRNADPNLQIILPHQALPSILGPNRGYTPDLCLPARNGRYQTPAGAQQAFLP